MHAERKPLDATAVSVMVLLCLIWGVGHVAAKFAAQGISLVFQSGIRSVVATGLLLAWVHLRRIPLWERDRTFWPGILAGLLFATEFIFIFAGLALTDAARMVVFVYLAPCMTAFGLHFLIPQERLNARQWAGVLLAFAGVAVAFGDGFASRYGLDMRREHAVHVLRLDRGFRIVLKVVIARSEAADDDDRIAAVRRQRSRHYSQNLAWR